MGSGTSWGMVGSSTSIPAAASAALNSVQNTATGRAASATLWTSPHAVRTYTRWSKKSASTSKIPRTDGTGPVEIPRAVTYNATCANSGSGSDSATRTLPRICNSMCSVSRRALPPVVRQRGPRAGNVRTHWR